LPKITTYKHWLSHLHPSRQPKLTLFTKKPGPALPPGFPGQPAKTDSDTGRATWLCDQHPFQPLFLPAGFLECIYINSILDRCQEHQQELTRRIQNQNSNKAIPTCLPHHTPINQDDLIDYLCVHKNWEDSLLPYMFQNQGGMEKNKKKPPEKDKDPEVRSNKIIKKE
jgi:hypothetical protein